ncbi:MAG: hypothetical protein AB4352_25035, partial [Hormoscilla sp.]
QRLQTAAQRLQTAAQRLQTAAQRLQTAAQRLQTAAQRLQTALIRRSNSEGRTRVGHRQHRPPVPDSLRGCSLTLILRDFQLILHSVNKIHKS